MDDTIFEKILTKEIQETLQSNLAIIIEYESENFFRSTKIELCIYRNGKLIVKDSALLIN